MPDSPALKATGPTLLQQAKEATQVAEAAFAAGNKVVGIAAITLAAELIQLAKIWGHTE